MTDLVDGGHISEEDLALYAMGSFEDSQEVAESARIKAHLADCAACRQALAEVGGDLALLGLSVAEEPLPSGARDRFMQRIVAEPRLRTVPSTEAASDLANGATVPQALPDGRAVGHTLPFVAPRSPSRRNPVFTVLPWMLAAAMLAGAVYLGSEVSELRSSRDQARAELQRVAVKAARAQEVVEVLTSPKAQRVTLTEGTPGPAPTGHTSYMPSHGALVFVASNMHALPASKAYELWIIPANGHAPMPAGTFRPDDRGSASVVLPPLPVGVAAKAFGVTIEKAEGSAAPTLPIIMSGS